MDVSEDVAGTLRAEDHGHPPLVVADAEYAGAFHINQRSEGIDLHDVSGALMATQSDQMQTFITERKAAGFCTEHSANSRSIGYEEEKSPTLRAGVVPAAIALENHPLDGRIRIEADNTVQTLTNRMGTGGMNVPLVMESEPTPKTLKIRCGGGSGGKGALIQEDKSATLATNNDQTLFQPKPEFKAYGVCSKHSHSMLSDNPHAGFYEAETSRTLDRGGGNPCCAQGGIAVLAFAQNQRNEVRDLGEKSGALSAEPGSKQQTYIAEQKPQGFDRYNGAVTGDVAHTLDTSSGDNVPMVFALQGSMIGRENKNGPQGSGVNEDVCFTLDGADRHAVAYEESASDDTHSTYCATTGNFMTCSREKSQTLMARDYKDPQIINDTEQPEEKLVPEPEYIVRRLTPTECAALQGFPRWWCANLGINDPTDEQIAFWKDVFETHRLATKPTKKPKTEKQIRKWLADPHTDSAEYSMWGNGICLPIVFMIMCGIAWAAGLDKKEEYQ